MRKNLCRNWILNVGLLLNAIMFVLNHCVTLPDFILGFGFGLAIGMMLIGIYSANHDMKKIRNFKKALLTHFVK